MANYAFTDYAIEAERTEIEKVNEFFNGILAEAKESGRVGRNTIQEFVTRHNPEAKGDMRGDWDRFGYDEEYGVVYVSTESAWNRNDLFEQTIKEIAPSAKFYYYCDCDDGFECNDEESKYFAGKYRIDYSLEEDCDIENFATLEEFLERFNELMNTDCKTYEEAEQAAEDYEDDEYFINVYQ